MEPKFLFKQCKLILPFVSFFLYMIYQKAREVEVNGGEEDQGWDGTTLWTRSLDGLVPRMVSGGFTPNSPNLG